MMNLIVDASIVIKWLVAEDDSDAALLIRTENDIAAPDLLLIECRNALLNKLRRNELQLAEAQNAERAIQAMGIDVFSSAPLLPRAFAIALDLTVPIYDCIYLAAAIATDRKLITADRRFAAVVAKSAVGYERIELLNTAVP